MHAVFTRKNKRLSRVYDREFMPSYTTSQDGITCPGKCRSQSQSVAIVFTRHSCHGSVCEQNFSNGRRVHQSFSFISLTISTYGPVRFSSSLARTLLWHGVAMQNAFLHYSISSHLPHFWGLVNRILWKKCLLDLLRTKKVEICTRLVLTSASSLGHFWKLRPFVMRIFWVRGLDSGLNFCWKQMSRLTRKCWSVNKYLERMFS